MKKSIALLAGGDSSERIISIQSAAQIAPIIDTTQYNVYQIDIQGRNWTYRDAEGNDYQVDKNDFSITVNGCKIVFDYALILIHGTPGEDGRLQGYLDIMGIPYSSCDLISSAITFDKRACKAVVGQAGISLAKEVFVRRGQEVDVDALIEELGLPMFVKPNASGSSFGVTKVKSREQIASAIETALKESDAVLIEEYLAGREFGCGVMIAGGKEYLLPIAEIISKREFFDFEAKYTEGFSDEIVPADIPKQLADKIGSLALTAYKACGCRGIVRIDFIVRDNVPYMVEINSVPGMSGGSIVPKQVKASGMTMTELFNIVIQDTLKR